IGTADRDQGNLEILSVSSRQKAQGLARIVHADDAAIRKVGGEFCSNRQEGSGPFLHGLGKEIMTIEPIPWQGNKQVTFTNLARVRADPSDADFRRASQEFAATGSDYELK